MSKIFGRRLVKRWGNSFIIRFSPDEVEILNLKENDIIDFQVTNISNERNSDNFGNTPTTKKFSLADFGYTPTTEKEVKEMNTQEEILEDKPIDDYIVDYSDEDSEDSDSEDNEDEDIDSEKNSPPENKRDPSETVYKFDNEEGDTI